MYEGISRKYRCVGRDIKVYWTLLDCRRGYQLGLQVCRGDINWNCRNVGGDIKGLQECRRGYKLGLQKCRRGYQWTTGV